MKKVILCKAFLSSLFCGMLGVIFMIWVIPKLGQTGLGIKNAGELGVSFLATSIVSFKKIISLIHNNIRKMIIFGWLISYVDSFLILTENIWIIVASCMFVGYFVLNFYFCGMNNIVNETFHEKELTQLQNQKNSFWTAGASIGAVLGAFIPNTCFCMFLICFIETTICFFLSWKMVNIYEKRNFG